MSKKYYGALIEYSKIVHEIDSAYGGPRYNNKRQIKGRKMLFQIFRYLSTHRSSTCEDIAQYEMTNNHKSKRKLKSITDDIRKFILNNLLPKKLIKEEGTKKKYNKKIQAYSLDHNGVLYAIHLLSNNKRHAKYPETIIYDESIVGNLAVEYPEYLPFVFDRLDVFKSALGKNWLDYLKLHEIAENGLYIINRLYGPADVDDFLNSFVGRSAFVLSTSEPASENLSGLDAWYNHKKYRKTWTNLQQYLKVDDPWGIGITLLVYNNMLGKLFREDQRRYYIEGDPEQIRRKIMNQCKKIFEKDSDLWNWYWAFVSDVISTMQKDMKQLKVFDSLLAHLCKM